MKALTITGVLVIASLAAPPASAQEPESSLGSVKATSPAVQVTPFVSIDSRGSVPVGTAVSFPLASKLDIEAEVGYRRGEGEINALSSSVNLIYDLPRLGRVAPYLATGAGLAQYGAPLVGHNGSLLGTQPRIAFEINAGGGLKVPVNDKWGMRTDARWFKPVSRDAAEHWRVSQGVSFDVKKK
jgi:hypothetical protein